MEVLAEQPAALAVQLAALAVQLAALVVRSVVLEALAEGVVLSAGPGAAARVEGLAELLRVGLALSAELGVQPAMPDRAPGAERVRGAKDN